MSKIFNLILFSSSNEYNEMKNIISEYLKFTKIDYFFYCYDNTIKKEYIIDDDILKMKGNETYIPGILDKTIKAIEIVTNELKFKFNYILRTNISTIVDIFKLQNYLNNNPINYSGTCIFNLTWVDPDCGIFDNRYKGLEYVSGTGILISYNCIQLLLKNKQNIDMSLIDDVSIGVFFKNNNIFPDYIYDGRIGFNWNEINFNSNIIFYRNKRHSRLLDCYILKLIIYNITNNTNKNKVIENEQNFKVGEVYYGNSNYFNVTDIFNNCFKKSYNQLNNHILIMKDINFNDFFGDPCVRIEKKLIIVTPNIKYIINEYRDSNLIIQNF